MRELIIKVDDPGERAWDGSSKVFEIKELVRCKDCKHGEKANDVYLCGKLRGFGTSHNSEWFCADGERK